MWFALLYFAEGAPIGWIWWRLPALLAQRGVAVDDVTALTSTVALVWALKFLWAPLVDRLQPWLPLRGWIVTAQLGMAATLAALLLFEPEAHLGALTALLLLHALCAATQDVAIDALAIRATPVAEQGRLNGAMQVGMILGRLLFSTGVLWFGWSHQATVVALAAVVLAIAGSVLLLPAGERPRHRHRPRQLRRWLAAVFATPRILWLALFALIGGAGFEAAGSLSGPWFVARGLDDDAIGTVRLLAALAMATGAVAGGVVADRRGARRAAALWLVAVAAVGLAMASADAAGQGGPALAAFVSLYLALGGLTAASYALFMQHSKGPMKATLFSSMMGLTNLCESWAGRLGGELARAYGYPVAMATPALLSLAGLWLLRRLR